MSLYSALKQHEDQEKRSILSESDDDIVITAHTGKFLSPAVFWAIVMVLMAVNILCFIATSHKAAFLRTALQSYLDFRDTNDLPLPDQIDPLGLLKRD